jgi:hypothetical protein
MLTVQAKNQNDTESIKFTNNARKAYMDMTEATALITLKAFKDPDAAMKQNGEIVKKLVQSYIEYTNNIMDSGRNLEEDTFFNEEMFVCGAILKKLRS